MRVLFLDFDGVLHPAGEAAGTTVLFEWYPILVRLLEPWTEVFLAVHSSWRYDHRSDELRELLEPLGTRFIGSVPRGPRAESIRWFLQANPVIDDHLALDDSPGEFSIGGVRLIVCDPSKGISDPAIQQQIQNWLAAPKTQHALQEQ